jgi:hypothetical protein
VAEICRITGYSIPWTGPKEPDIIFLDIRMRSHDGFEMLIFSVHSLRDAGFGRAIGKPVEPLGVPESLSASCGMKESGTSLATE